MDKYFEARSRFNTVGLGAQSYLHDVNRTYGSLPARANSQTFARAMHFREEEKKRVDALAAENETLRAQMNRYTTVVTRAREELAAQRDEISALNSKLSNVSHGASATRSSVGPRTDGVSPIQEPSVGGSGDADGVQREVLPTERVPSPRGRVEEHTAEGRPAADDGVSEQPAGGDV